MQMPQAIQSYAILSVVCDWLLKKILLYETIHLSVQ